MSARTARVTSHESPVTRVLSDDGSPLNGAPATLHLAQEEIDYALERIESERLPDGRAQVRVGVDVVEDQAAVLRFEILDSPYVELSCRDDLLAPRDGLRRHFVVRIELDRRRLFCIQRLAGRHLATTDRAVFGVTCRRRAQVETAVRDHAH